MVLPAAELEQRFEDGFDLPLGARDEGFGRRVVAYVDGEVVGVLVERTERTQEVGRSVTLVGGVVFGYVAADDGAAARALDVGDDSFDTGTLDDGVVYECVVSFETVQTPRGRAALRAARAFSRFGMGAG